MITAGYYIGQILDDLASIGSQVDNRNRVGLFEMTKLLENFYRDILNEIYGFNLTNTNETSSNAPAVDLVDSSKGVAIQVTSSGTSAKINKTLEALTDDQIAAYPMVIVLVAGKKQRSFTLTDEFVTRANFKIENVWDYTDLCRSLVNLPLDKLQSLHQIVTKQIARVKIELEIPAQDGTYATGIEQFAEAIPRERLSDLKKFTQFVQADSGATEEEVRKFITTLVADLKELPRITREVFEFMWSRRDKQSHSGYGTGDHFKMTDERLRRLLTYKDLDGDLLLLIEAGFLDHWGPQELGENKRFFVLSEGDASSMLDGYGQYFLDTYMTKNGIVPKKVFVSLDFGDF